MKIIRSISYSLCSLGLALALSGCTTETASLSPLPPVANGHYTLGTGDEVRVYVYGLDQFNNATFTVADDGMISMPMIDKVPARGKSFSELEGAIKQALLDRDILKAPIVNVQPAALRPFYILGEVNKPGEYNFRPGMSVLAAVSMAGGFTFRADQRSVSITRAIDGKPVVGRASTDDPIQPGDQIQVFERWF